MKKLTRKELKEKNINIGDNVKFGKNNERKHLMKFKRIKKESDLKPNSTYFETTQNNSPSDSVICVQYYVLCGFPFDYPHNCNVLRGSRWINAYTVWDNEIYYPYDMTSLSDMGVTDNPHNNHKLYLIIEGSLDEISKLTYKQVEAIANQTDV